MKTEACAPSGRDTSRGFELGAARRVGSTLLVGVALLTAASAGAGTPPPSEGPETPPPSADASPPPDEGGTADPRGEERPRIVIDRGDERGRIVIDASSGLTEVLEEFPAVANKLVDEAERKAAREARMMERMTPDQVYEIMLARAKDDPPPAVAIVVPIAFFLTVIIVVGLVLYFRERSEEQRHLTMRQALERGADIPTELLLGGGKPRSDLRRGLLFLFGGLGFAALLAGSGDGDWTIGLFPAMLGFGYLVFWYLDRRGFDGGRPRTYKY